MSESVRKRSMRIYREKKGIPLDAPRFTVGGSEEAMLELADRLMLELEDY